MSWKDIGKAVAEYAPLLGGVIGGPAGAGIGGLVASAFGVEETPEAVMEALSTDPQVAMKLRQVEMDHKVELEKLALKTLEVELDDKQDARKNNKHSLMPAILSCVLSVVIIAIIYLLFYLEPPEGSKDVLFMVLGIVLKEWGGSMQYWFGTTRSSAEKNNLLK